MRGCILLSAVISTIFYSCSSGKANDSESLATSDNVDVAANDTIAYTVEEMAKIDSMYRLYAKYGWVTKDSSVTEEERRRLLLDADPEQIEMMLKSIKEDSMLTILE